MRKLKNLFNEALNHEATRNFHFIDAKIFNVSTSTQDQRLNIIWGIPWHVWVCGSYLLKRKSTFFILADLSGRSLGYNSWWPLCGILQKRRWLMVLYGRWKSRQSLKRRGALIRCLFAILQKSHTSWWWLMRPNAHTVIKTNDYFRNQKWTEILLIEFIIYKYLWISIRFNI